jgi:hypothetical protein
MVGVSWNPRPPMAEWTVEGNFGRFLQAFAADTISTTSQVSVIGLFPPQMSSLERPFKKYN